MIATSAVNFTAYRVVHRMNCEPDEVIGYFIHKLAAEYRRFAYIEEKGLKEEAPCCSSSKNVVVEEIFIQG